MVLIPDSRSAELPSGGVPVLVPDLKGEAPIEVQERVKRERQERHPMQRDAKGRPQIAIPRGFGGGGVNVITLPKFSEFERVGEG